MKKKILRLIITTPLLILISYSISSARGHSVINGEELVNMMKDGEREVIVDVREPYLYKRSHIPGAINIPYDGAHKRVVKELPRDTRIVFVCHGGPMGDELSAILTDNGFTKVYNLRGGMRRWRGPLER